MGWYQLVGPKREVLDLVTVGLTTLEFQQIDRWMFKYVVWDNLDIGAMEEIIILYLTIKFVSPYFQRLSKLAYTKWMNSQSRGMEGAALFYSKFKSTKG